MRARASLLRFVARGSCELPCSKSLRAAVRSLVPQSFGTNATPALRSALKSFADLAVAQPNIRSHNDGSATNGQRDAETGACAASRGLRGYVCREGKRSALAVQDTSKSQASVPNRCERRTRAVARLRAREQLRTVQSIGLGRCETYRTRASAPPLYSLGFTLESSSARREAVIHHGHRSGRVHLVHFDAINRV